MHLYDESTPRRTIWSAQINWSRELTFSQRQVAFIKENVPSERGVYCIYAKNHKFDCSSPDWSNKRWSRVIYVGSGWLNNRLSSHLSYQKNNVLADYLAKYDIGFRFDRIVDTDVAANWPKTVEASLLHLFEQNFGKLPPANRRHETIPDLQVDNFILQESPYFSFLARG